MTSTGLKLYTIYRNPLDHPKKIVVREWHVIGAGAEPLNSGNAWLFETVEQARAHVRKVLPGAERLPRSDGDEPQILETWI